MPSTSIQRRFLRPALNWLITAEPAMSFAVRNMIKALSSFAHPPARRVAWIVLMVAVEAGRCLIVMDVVATSRRSGHRSPIHKIAPV